ncbi:MAG TPA: alpha/beta hydrolase [Pyrinomonadaceae bacterium]|nr:alpha/beta hydrolase [Pyrinomonadaceae bacterium]
MQREIIHFAHANGFPAKTYNKLFSFLDNDFEIGYLERHAHNPKFPVTDGWRFLKEELHEEIEKRYKREIIGVGHSFGGILHFLAAVEHPELYKQIILLDAPLISRLSGAGVKFLKKTNLMDKFSPSRQTRFRRNRWQSKEEAFEHFRQKEKFARFDEDCLRDYIEFGTVPNEKGVKLFFERQIEAKIYRSLPHNFAKYRGKLKVPTAYIGGTKSKEAALARLGFMRRNFPIDFYFLEGSHLFPLEKPEETSLLIKQVIVKLSA